MSRRCFALLTCALAFTVLFFLGGCGGGGGGAGGITSPSTDAQAVIADKIALTWSEIAGWPDFLNPSEADVHFNLSIPAAGANGTTITWQTTNGTRVAANGTVSMNPNGSGTTAVTLTATITKGAESDTKQFNLTVREAPVLTDEQTLANAVLALVNAERANVGAGALTMDPLLVNAAQRHSQDMASHGFMNHTGSDGSAFNERIADAGYAYTACAENVAWNYTTAAAVVAGWMGSPGHRANILNPNYVHMGISCYRSTHGWYWTQNFGRN